MRGLLGRDTGRGTLVRLYDRIVDCKRGASLAARTRAVLHRVHVPSRSASASRARAMLAIRHAVLDELCERTRCRDEKLVRGVLRHYAVDYRQLRLPVPAWAVQLAGADYVRSLGLDSESP